MHLNDNPNCSSSPVVESSKHYFMDCPLYAGPRVELVNSISNYTDFSIKVLFIW